MARNPRKPSGKTKARKTAAKPRARGAAARRVLVLVATRKGAWLYHGDAARKTWRADGPHFLGHIINHVVLDPRDGRTLLAAAKTGHLGPTVFRSTDLGPHLEGSGAAAGFRQGGERRDGPRRRPHLLADARPCERARASGTPAPRRRACSAPRTAASTWEPFSGFNDDPQYRDVDGQRAGRHARRPEAALDHRRSARSRRISTSAMSGGGVHESLDGGATLDAAGRRAWKSSRASTRPPIAFHDPHCVRLCPSNPDRLYQQNHCGIYRLDRPSTQWVRIGKAHAEEGRRHRLSDGGASARRRHRLGVSDGRHRPCGRAPVPTASPRAYVTRNGGKSWQRLDAGLPKSQAWWTVKRQAMTRGRAAIPSGSISARPAASSG